MTRNTDPAHAETDRILVRLEKKLKHTYSEAFGNAVEKFTAYMAAFEAKDRAHRADVSAGRWSEQEYTNWKRNQLLYGNTLAQIRDTLAADLHHVNRIAVEMIRGRQVDVYALNHNYGTYEVEHGLGIDTSYTLYDHDTVERLMKEDPELLPKPSAKRQREIDAKDIAWNKQKLTSNFTASILAGDDIPTMARRISTVASMNQNAAIRNARTMCTGAENGGRMNAYKRAEGMGIDLKQQWVATLDGRTRDSHRELDGETIKVGETFSNGLRFPGDPEGAAGEVYNCRCCTVAVVNGIDPMAFDKTDVLRRKLENTEITYEQWKTQHRRRRMAAGSSKWPPYNGRISHEQYKEVMAYGREKGVKMEDIKNYGGDIQDLKDAVDSIATIGADYPMIFEGRRPVTLRVGPVSGGYAETNGHRITLNEDAYRDNALLAQDYLDGVISGRFTKGSTYKAIPIHELGHVIANRYGIDGKALAKEITGIDNWKDLSEFLEENLSEYSAEVANGEEIISECFASVYGSTTPSNFALQFVERCRNLALIRRQ